MRCVKCTAAAWFRGGPPNAYTFSWSWCARPLRVRPLVVGEMLQMYTSLPFVSPLAWKLTVTLLAVYLPGGPFMIGSMFRQRAGATKKRAEAAKAKAGAASAAPAVNGLVCVHALYLSSFTRVSAVSSRCQMPHGNLQTDSLWAHNAPPPRKLSQQP